MRKRIMFRKYIAFLFTMLTVEMLGCIFANADSYDKIVEGKSYEMEDGTGFSRSNDTLASELCFGDSSLGSLYLQGDLETRNPIDKCDVYSTASELTISYHYNGKCQNTDNKEWHLCNSSSKKVADVPLDKSVDCGAVIVQSSSDRSSWNTVNRIYDVFDDNTLDLLSVYRISQNEIRTGLFFRVMVAYRLERTYAEDSVLFIPTSKEEYREILEEYVFYVTYSENAVHLYDLMTHEDVSEKNTVEKGFIVDKGGTYFDVSVKKDNESAVSVSDLSTFCKPGKYSIDIKSELGKSYTYSIEVTKGLEYQKLTPEVYDSGKNGEYDESGLISGDNCFGKTSLTEMKVAQSFGEEMKHTQKAVFNAYGVKGTFASLFLRVNIPYGSESNTIKMWVNS